MIKKAEITVRADEPQGAADRALRHCQDVYEGEFRVTSVKLVEDLSESWTTAKRRWVVELIDGIDPSLGLPTLHEVRKMGNGDVQVTPSPLDPDELKRRTEEAQFRQLEGVDPFMLKMLGDFENRTGHFEGVEPDEEK